MRLIDADKLKKPLKGLIKDEWLGLTEAGAVQNMLDNAPTIDAVEVVRCKDCDWWEKSKDSIQGRCARYGFYPTGTYYCASGERKE